MFLCFHTSLYIVLSGLMVLYRFLCGFIRFSKVFTWFYVGSYCFSQVCYGSLWFFTVSYGFTWFYEVFYMVFICLLYTFYIPPIHIEGQDEGQKVATRKVEDGQKTLFPKIVGGPSGCHQLSSLVPKSRFSGSRNKFFFKLQNEV